jgi:CHAD domain-containing protein
MLRRSFVLWNPGPAGPRFTGEAAEGSRWVIVGYRFEQGETIPDGARRIACEQVEAALAALGDPNDLGLEETVHDVRTRCKKLRGLLRLVRPALGNEYACANAAFRDAARELSPIRDAQALESTFDELVAAHPGSRPKGAAAVAHALEQQAAKMSDAMAGGGGSERIERAIALLEGAPARIDRWPLDDQDGVLAGGVAKTYKRGRSAFRSSLEAPSAEHLHEWRKRVKDTWYHVRLLEPSAPSVLGPLRKRFHDLSDTLGDDHDLAVLVAALRESPQEHGGEEAARAMVLLAEARRADLRERAHRLGARLYLESPCAFAARLAGYRDAWLEHGPELPAGEMAAIADS